MCVGGRGGYSTVHPLASHNAHAILKMASGSLYQGFGTLKFLGSFDSPCGSECLKNDALYSGRLLVRPEPSYAGTHLDFLPKLLTGIPKPSSDPAAAGLLLGEVKLKPSPHWCAGVFNLHKNVFSVRIESRRAVM